MSGYFVLNIAYVGRPPEQRNFTAPITTIGRERGDIVLNDPQSSTRHAEIHFDNGRVTVRDTGSTNGTWFNGQRQTEFALETGQMFHCGQTTLQLMYVQATPTHGPMGTVVAMAAPQPSGWVAPAPGAPRQDPGYAAAQQPPPGVQQAQSGGYGAPPPEPPPGAWNGAPQAPHPVPPVAASAAGDVRTSFQGRGGELALILLVGALLTLVTLGIYLPWLVCRMTGFILGRTTIGPTQRGDLRFEFTGKGGELAVTMLLGGLLTIVTLGIYAPWFLCNTLRFFATNTVAIAADGTRYRFRFDGQGGDLLVTVLLGYLLTIVTFGIYLPWFFCKVQKAIHSRIFILENEQQVGHFDFEGKGGELLFTFLLGYLLILVTFGVYMPWFQVKIFRFMAAATRVIHRGRVFAGEFQGTGGQYFVTFLVGLLLTIVTLYIYLPWFIVTQWKFQWNNRVFRELGQGLPTGA